MEAKPKFVWDARKMELVEGKGPTRDGQLVKGVDLKGNPMELVGFKDEGDLKLVCYWGWS